MQIFIAPDYEEMSKQAALAVKQLMQPATDPLICTASGDTPAGLYHQMINLVNSGELNISNWNFVALDEWVGLNGDDEGSCRYHLDRQLFNPLKVATDKIWFFDGRTTNLQSQCEDAESFITKHNGIDVAIVGLGMNGHIGMNEPGTSPVLRTHVTNLDPLTQKVGQKYFKESRELTEGITLGLATIMDARHIILLVSGKHKASIVRRVLKEGVSAQLPASQLVDHPGFNIYLDEEAASLINAG